MAFLKIAHERAYYTGAMRTNLPLRRVAARLTRRGVCARLTGERLTLTVGDDRWAFSAWQPDGLGCIGWLEMTSDGDLSRLSRALAAAGLRHRFEHSRPLALDTIHVRCITRYDYRWAEGGLAPSGPAHADVETFEEPVPGLAA